MDFNTEEGRADVWRRMMEGTAARVKGMLAAPDKFAPPKDESGGYGGRLTREERRAIARAKRMAAK